MHTIVRKVHESIYIYMGRHQNTKKANPLFKGREIFKVMSLFGEDPPFLTQN